MTFTPTPRQFPTQPPGAPLGQRDKAGAFRMEDPVLGRAMSADDWAYLAIRLTLVEPHAFDDLLTARDEIAAALTDTDDVTWEDLVDRHVAVATTLTRTPAHQLHGHEDDMIVLADALDGWFRRALLFRPPAEAKFWVKVFLLRKAAYMSASEHAAQDNGGD